MKNDEHEINEYEVNEYKAYEHEAYEHEANEHEAYEYKANDYEVIERPQPKNSNVTSYLKQYRLLKNMTQAELARRTGIPIKTIQQYEQGQKNINKAQAEYVIKLSYVLGCRPEQLLVMSDRPEEDVPQKYFNTLGACDSRYHYMVPLEKRLQQVKLLIDQGKYFSINAARQYGKTTMLHALGRFLQRDYVVLFMDFQTEMSSNSFCSEQHFCAAFWKAFKERTPVNAEALFSQIERDFLQKQSDFDLVTLFEMVSCFCSRMEREVVLLIDEVDSATNNQVFMDFLAQLRGYYLQRNELPIFKSVLLVGVYDVKNLKRKLHDDTPYRENSPWNIAADFDVAMDFSVEDIALLLQSYCNDRGVSMDCKGIGEEIFAYTSGYPYLVSRICLRMDEDKSLGGFSITGVRNAVGRILKEQNPLFEDMAKKLREYPVLRSIIYDILFSGHQYPYNINVEWILIGVMFGFLRDEDGHVAVSNRIFEVWFYNLFIAEDAIGNETYSEGMRNKPEFINGNTLNMEYVLEKFTEHFQECFSGCENRFIEENGRRLFLLYIRPLINGVGNYYIGSRTRSMGRTDIVLDYLGNRYVIELKIWRGDEYPKKGEVQLTDYLKDYQLQKGYMLSFSFNKNKKTGITTHHFRDVTIVEAVV